jgi:hypothetical protein
MLWRCARKRINVWKKIGVNKATPNTGLTLMEPVTRTNLVIGVGARIHDHIIIERTEENRTRPKNRWCNEIMVERKACRHCPFLIQGSVRVAEAARGMARSGIEHVYHRNDRVTEENILVWYRCVNPTTDRHHQAPWHYSAGTEMTPHQGTNMQTGERR